MYKISQWHLLKQEIVLNNLRYPDCCGLLRIVSHSMDRLAKDMMVHTSILELHVQVHSILVCILVLR